MISKTEVNFLESIERGLLIYEKMHNSKPFFYDEAVSILKDNLYLFSEGAVPIFFTKIDMVLIIKKDDEEFNIMVNFDENGSVKIIYSKGKQQISTECAKDKLQETIEDLRK